MSIRLFEERCLTACRLCEAICPGDVIFKSDSLPQFIMEECWHCGVCENACPTQALEVHPWIPHKH